MRSESIISCMAYHRKIAAKQQKFESWKRDIQGTKERYTRTSLIPAHSAFKIKIVFCCSLADVIGRKRALAEAQGCVLLARRRIELVKQAYENSKSLLQQGTSDKNSQIEIYLR